ncbi:MAG TPA: fumarate hydratase [Syntrophales bacterium]|nr:fumarate hydratase [Syntrophales bacterium]HPQ42682.1 fumarate hydratase [Syntrophales bacterium]
MDTIREIPTTLITDMVKNLFIKASSDLGEDVLSAVRRAAESEHEELARYALDKIIENAQIAKETTLPLCQDTGLAVVFVEIGQDVHVTGGDFNEAVQEGVRRAYTEGFLRKSVCDPITRANTGDNTPAIIHTEIVPGDKIHIIAMPKGGGSENMSSSVMLLPSSGLEGIKNHIVQMVQQAGPNPCPPVIVGVGIGGSIEKSALLAKKALARPVGEPNRFDARLSELEGETLTEINKLGIGPQGYGGTTTALAVHVEMMPCHIASLPVTVNIQCHVARHKEATI